MSKYICTMHKKKHRHSLKSGAEDRTGKTMGLLTQNRKTLLWLDRVIGRKRYKIFLLTCRSRMKRIGCGKGRVLAYLLKSHAPCRLCGIEINEISGRIAQEWTQKYDRADVMIGDAFRLDYNDYTVLFLGRPFLPKTFQQFLESWKRL